MPEVMPHSAGASQPRTRYAPSPTGWLHLGHVANAVWTWGVAAQRSASVLLRIEDHDRARCRPEYERQILEDLQWLGFAASPETLASLAAGPSPWRQSDSQAEYDAALQRLSDQGLVYGCSCSRSTLARELGDGVVEGRELVYPGICRNKGIPPGPGVGTRIRLPDDAEEFADLRMGPQRQEPQRQCGDLLARDRNGNWTYQFAVTVDDLRHGVTLVIRGEDLLSSTGRQLSLARLLGRADPPVFLHHPIIRNDTGEKLSKRERDLGLREMRARGMSAEDVIAEAGRRSGWGS
jgi:glutamyl-tRNA synthetase/glutamyl-Q tRNA(Asp) synthetase